MIVKPNPDTGSTFLLTDGNGGFFIWNECDGRMWRFKKDHPRTEDIVDKVRSESYDSTELTAQYRADDQRQQR